MPWQHLLRVYNPSCNFCGKVRFKVDPGRLSLLRTRDIAWLLLLWQRSLIMGHGADAASPSLLESQADGTCSKSFLAVSRVPILSHARMRLTLGAHSFVFLPILSLRRFRKPNLVHMVPGLLVLDQFLVLQVLPSSVSQLFLWQPNYHEVTSHHVSDSDDSILHIFWLPLPTSLLSHHGRRCTLHLPGNLSQARPGPPCLGLGPSGAPPGPLCGPGLPSPMAPDTHHLHCGLQSSW